MGVAVGVVVGVAVAAGVAVEVEVGMRVGVAGAAWAMALTAVAAVALGRRVGTAVAGPVVGNTRAAVGETAVPAAASAGRQPAKTRPTSIHIKTIPVCLMAAEL